MDPAQLDPPSTDAPRVSAAAARIREAATTAFSEHGYGGTSTRDITRRLGLSAAAMYPHYQSKQTLLYAISLEGHLAALAEMRSADDPETSPTQRLREVVWALAHWQAEQSQLARVVQYELRSLSPENYRTIAGIRRETQDVIREIIKTGRETGEFTVSDPDGALLAIASFCIDICRWFPSSTHRDPDAIATLYADLAVRIVS